MLKPPAGQLAALRRDGRPRTAITWASYFKVERYKQGKAKIETCQWFRADRQMHTKQLRPQLAETFGIPPGS